MIKLVIAIPFWEGDRTEAMRLASFITDIEPAPRIDVAVLLMNRWDTAPAGQSILFDLSQKFIAWTYETKAGFTGWPAGCNAMAFEIFRLMAEDRSEEFIARDAAIFLMEPDCMPITRSWIDDLLCEWSKAQSSGKCIVGAWRPSGSHVGHINGNALYPIDTAKRFDLSYAGFEAWDSILAPQFEPHWMKSGVISNRWQERNLTPEQIERPQYGTVPPSIVHGCKDSSAYDYAKNKLG